MATEGGFQLTQDDGELRSFRILILDYGVGNIGSVANAIARLDYDYKVSSDLNAFEKASLIILPGVGAFPEGMKNLEVKRLIDPLNDAVFLRRIPILGICLGMQLMAKSSEEYGHHKGLGWLDGDVVKLPAGPRVTVPHAGWADLDVLHQTPFFSRIAGEPSFYFDHSYYLKSSGDYVAAYVNDGQGITAAVQQENIYGVQFHPEKSQKNGLRLLRGYIEHIRTGSTNSNELVGQ